MRHRTDLYTELQGIHTFGVASSFYIEGPDAPNLNAPQQSKVKNLTECTVVAPADDTFLVQSLLTFSLSLAHHLDSPLWHKILNIVTRTALRALRLLCT